MAKAIKKLITSLIKEESLTDFVSFNDLLLFLPIRDALVRCVSFELDKYENEKVEVKSVYLPLYVLHTGFYLTYSKTLNWKDSKTNKTFDYWTLEDKESILNAITMQAIPYLSVAPSAADFAVKAKSLGDGNNLAEAEICSLVKSGKDTEALARLKLFKLRHFFYSGIGKTKERLQTLEESLRKGEGSQILNQWIEQSINNLHLSGIESLFKH